ncbi:MAG: acylphosphatase [Anaerolineae bacterium]|nr:acylphosphatase [Anaerolineae bacterium]
MTDVSHSITAVHIIVHGYVQGVGFRSFVQMQALPLEISGWVRNCADGTVEIWAEGSRNKLERLAQQVQKGPRHGSVDRLDIDWQQPKNLLHGFHIRW